ncbi:MAG: hypothetical protein QOJ65_2214 [Fimbriimonadaceae bacterium]|jgi:hypothetical protein|nr:hypothetical protein [Fimbriimonadaceae bacterium]
MLFGLVLIALSGCGKGSGPQPEATAAAEPEVKVWPDFNSPPGMLGFLLDGGEPVKIGEDIDRFRTAFPREANKVRSMDPSDVPGGLPTATGKYSVWGWQYGDVRRGVGALLADNRVALVMRQLDNVQPKDVEDEVARYQKAFGTPRTVQAGEARYWFWEAPPGRIMICALQNGQNATNLTTAYGDSRVMNHLKMSPEKAAEGATQDRLSREVVNPG